MTRRSRDTWIWVDCRFCGRRYECIAGMPAERTRTCLWCFADQRRGAIMDRHRK